MIEPAVRANGPPYGDFPASDIWQLIEWRAAKTPNGQFLVDDHGRRLTFGSYRDAAQRVASGLTELGVGEGTVVGWQLPTRITTLVLLGALCRLGAVQVPLLPSYRERELGFITQQTGARLLAVPEVGGSIDYQDLARKVARQTAGLDVLVVTEDLWTRVPASVPPVTARAQPPVRWVFYTSGTTAEPKGVKHTDQTLIASAFGSAVASDLVAEDVYLMLLQVAHIGGPVQLCSSLLSGSSNVVLDGFEISRAVHAINAEKVTIAAGAVPILRGFLEEHRRRPNEALFRSVRAFPCGGAAKPPQLHHAIRSELGGIGILSGYGLTECPILAKNATSDPDEKLAVTEGRPTPGIVVRVVKPDGTMAGPGEIGELHVTGPQLFKGYVDPHLEREAFDDDGLLLTGDLGFQDAQGYVTITGRRKDVIIRKGENISPREIEELLLDHPAIRDVAVVGIRDPDMGERCCAVVVLDPEARTLALADVVAYLRTVGLMPQKLPERLEIVEDLPRNSGGKVLKEELRSRFSPVA